MVFGIGFLLDFVVFVDFADTVGFVDLAIFADFGDFGDFVAREVEEAVFLER